MNAEWLALVEAEGTITRPPSALVPDEDSGELPCPACGTVAPLVEGACTDCGLQLE